MNLHQLSKIIETNVVNNENGWGEDIEYHHTNNPVAFATRAMVTNGDFQVHTKGDKPTLEDKMSFLSVVLDEKPTRNDRIFYESEYWEVEFFYGQNPYDIVCSRNTRHTNARSARRKY